jgi:3-deoxy-D-manno-octulosonic acid kinase
LLNKKYNSYHFGLSTAFTDQQLEQLVKLFNTPDNRVDSVLGGRTSVKVVRIPGLGPVVVKYYARGGLIQHFIKRSYLRWGKTRCQIEYEILNKVRYLGIGAPEPVAFAFEGRLFYRCWLITKEIKRHQTLAQLSLDRAEQAYSVMGKIADQVNTLIKNQIFHVDLHPGNVLVDAYLRVFLIDFDRARLTRMQKNKLRKKYLNRWERAVTKHQLPERLNELMQSNLGTNYGKE